MNLMAKNYKLNNMVKILFAVLSLILIYSVLATASVNTNLVANPSFENGTIKPLNWKLVTYNQNIPKWDTVAHSGTHSVKISILGTKSKISGYPVSDIIQVNPLQSYMLSAWMKVRSVGGRNSPAVRVEEYDANMNWLAQTNLIFDKGTYDWTFKTINFTTGKNTKWVDVYANLWYGYGTFWVDDIALIDPAPVPPPPPVDGSSFRFIAFADSHSDPDILAGESRSIISSDLNPAFIIFPGDLCPDTNCFATDWKYQINGDVTGSTSNGLFDKTFATRGNHDTASVSGWQSAFNFAGVASRIGATNYVEQTNDMTYSFDYGNSHFVGIDLPGGDVSTISSSEIAWLDNDLAAAESRGLTHAFLFWHGPIYYVDDHPATPSSSLITALNKHPIVSAAFFGHEHVVTYTHIDSSRISAVTHPFEEFISGSAGAPPYVVDTARIDYCLGKSGSGCPQLYGYVTVDVSSSNFNVSFYNQDGTFDKLLTFSKGAAAVYTPTFSPPAGSYSNNQAVTISTLIDGAAIHYTTDGTIPTEASTVYTAPITVSSTTTIKAGAWETGMTPSSISSATYTISLPTPSGNVYYVSKSGSDSNPGTLAQPWLTIQKAANTMAAGDTVYIKRGTYNEQIKPLNNGAVGNLIKYAAYPGDENLTIIDGTGINLPWEEGLIQIDGKSYINITGLRITNSNMNGIRINGAGTDITIYKNWFDSTFSSAIAVWAQDSNSVDYTLYPRKNIIIDGNDIYRCVDRLNGYGECITLANGVDTFEIMNNHVHYNLASSTSYGGGEGIDATHSKNGRIHNNEMDHLGSVALYVDGYRGTTDNVTLYNNLVHDSANGISVAAEEDGVTGGTKNIQIYNNIIYDSTSPYNTALTISGCCINPGFIENVTISSNTIVKGGIYIDSAKTSNIIFRNNIADSYGVDAVVPEGSVTQDHNLFGIDAKFVNPTVHDFHLLVGSPAIDTGTATDAPNTDFDGNWRPQGAEYDIGAYEK